MYPKLKYLYFLPVFVACLVASCASDAPESKQEEEKIERGAELSFTTADLTRAITTGFGEFAVYGDMKFTGNEGAVPLVVFNKTGVRYLNDSWSYEGTQYWYHHHEHSFVAITPSAVLETGSAQYSGSRLSFTYTVPTTGGSIADRNSITDILAATHRRQYVEVRDESGRLQPEPGVKLKFSHIMSLVNVTLALDDDLMKTNEFVLIHKMELSGIRTRAAFNISPAERASGNQTDDCVVEVTGHDGDATLTIEYAEPRKLINKGSSASFFAADDALIMLPQVFAADSRAKITFTYTVNGDAEVPKKVAILLKDVKWECGKSYNIRGSFETDKAEVKLQTMGIDDWQQPEGMNGNAVSD